MTERLNRAWAGLPIALLMAGGCATVAGDSRAPTRVETARLDAWYADLLATGPVEPGWDARGADLPGIAGGSWLLLTDVAGRRQLIIPGGANEGAVIPPPWRVLRRWEHPGPEGARRLLQIQPLDARHILVAGGGYLAQGAAFCSDGGAELTLYERPAAVGEFTRWEAETLAGYLFNRMRGRALCTRYDSIGSGQYAVRNFDGAGGPLTTLDQAREIATVVSAGPVEALLGFDRN